MCQKAGLLGVSPLAHWLFAAQLAVSLLSLPGRPRRGQAHAAHCSRGLHGARARLSHSFSCVSRTPVACHAARVRHGVAASLILPFLRKPCNGCIAVHRRLILSASPVPSSDPSCLYHQPNPLLRVTYHPPPPIIQLHLNPRLHTITLLLLPTLLRLPPPTNIRRHPSICRSCHFLDSQLDLDVTAQPGLLIPIFLTLMSC